MQGYCIFRETLRKGFPYRICAAKQRILRQSENKAVRLTGVSE